MGSSIWDLVLLLAKAKRKGPPPEDIARRRKPIPWDGDATMSVDKKTTSRELYLKILSRPRIYEMLYRSEDQTGHHVTKSSILKKIVEEFQTKGLTHRTEMDLASRLRKWEIGFKNARTWLAANDIPNKEDGSKHDPATRSMQHLYLLSTMR